MIHSRIKCEEWDIIFIIPKKKLLKLEA